MDDRLWLWPLAFLCGDGRADSVSCRTNSQLPRSVAILVAPDFHPDCEFDFALGISNQRLVRENEQGRNVGSKDNLRVLACLQTIRVQQGLIAEARRSHRLCGKTNRNVRPAAQPRPATPIEHCTRRARWRKISRGSNCDWMKFPREVTTGRVPERQLVPKPRRGRSKMRGLA